MLNLAPAVSAAEETPAETRPAAANGTMPKPAAERWKRLKSQYDVAPAEPVRAARPEQVAPPAESVPATIQPLSDGFQPVAPGTPAPPLRTAAALQGAAGEAEPDFVLPMPADELTAEEILNRPEEDEAPVSPPLRTAARTPEAAQPPVAGADGPDKPLMDTATRGGRSLTPQMPAGPPRKTTQVRRISDIAPLNDFDRDTEIRQYAAEKAREFNVKFGGEQYAARNFPDVVVPWQAPTTKYYPLYFQDPALERYGHTHHPLVQPVISSARFSGQLVMMPYQMAIIPPWQLESPLGWYRPGDVVPKLRYPFPWNAKAAAVEAAAVTGFIYLIP